MIFTIFFSALWLGFLTAVSPCPLATNIAAISFISRKSTNKKFVIFSGLLYCFGRTIAYIILGITITSGLLGSSQISMFLQKYMNEALGPIMIILGLILLGLIGSGISFKLNSDKIQQKATNGGLFWAIPLGFVFALSFCPVSAGLFFGGLIPLTLKSNSPIIFPFIYGIGTAIPVIGFAVLMSFGSNYVGIMFNKLTNIEILVRRLAGIAFILCGIYYCLIHIYG